MATFANLFSSPKFASPADCTVKVRVGGKDGHKFKLTGILVPGPRDNARIQLTLEQLGTVKVSTPWVAGESGKAEDAEVKATTPTMLAAALAHVCGIVLPDVKPIEEQLADNTPQAEFTPEVSPNGNGKPKDRVKDRVKA